MKELKARRRIRIISGLKGATDRKMEGASIKEVIIEVEILVEGAVEYFFEAGAAGIDGVYL